MNASILPENCGTNLREVIREIVREEIRQLGMRWLLSLMSSGRKFDRPSLRPTIRRHRDNSLTPKLFVDLTLKPEKCHFGFEELQFLGHIVSHQSVRPDPDKIAAVANFPTPSDKKAVRCFLGLCAYYQRFIAEFSRIAWPLTNLTREDVPFVWGEDQQWAFHDLRQRVQTPPALAHFDEDAPTILHTDASNVYLGAVLVQFLLFGRHGKSYRLRQQDAIKYGGHRLP